MFADNISLNPTTYGGANAAKVYAMVGWGGDSSTIRRVADTATSAPETLTISHRPSTEGKVQLDQHMIRLDEVITDPILGQVKFSAWMVIRIPKGTSVITTAKVKDLVGRLIALEQGAGNIEKILNSEP